jgi:hypothetical protein
MKVYGQLENAQVESKASDFAGTLTGAIWWHTTDLVVKTSDGTNVRALLRNDAKLVIGNHATANNNIRLHRGASGVLQFLQGGDATAEGTLSTSLNQISGRLENYTDAGKPSAGNAGRVAWITDTARLKVDDGSNWQTVPTNADVLDSIYDIQNLSLAVGPGGGNTLLIALKNKAGNDPSATDPVKIAFRNSSNAGGDYSVLTRTSSLSMTISSGSTLGHASGIESDIWIYAINNAGTMELACSNTLYDTEKVISTSAEGGAGAADSNRTIYSTTARTNVAARIIGRVKISQATAGTWVSSPTAVILNPRLEDDVTVLYSSNSGTNTFSSATSTTVNYEDMEADKKNSTTTGSGWNTTINIAGRYEIQASCSFNSAAWTASNTIEVNIRKNGTSNIIQGYWMCQASLTIPVYVQAIGVVELAKDDTIDVRLYHNRNAGSITMDNQATANRFCLRRLDD